MWVIVGVLSMMPCRDIRIAIVHRDGLYRDCLRHSLAQTQLLSIVHSADGLGQETWQAVVACRPDLLSSILVCVGGKSVPIQTNG